MKYRSSSSGLLFPIIAVSGILFGTSSISASTIVWSAPVVFNGLTTSQIFTNTPGTIVGAVGFGIEEPALVTYATNSAATVFDIFADQTVASVTGTNGIAFGTGSFPAATAYTTGNTNFDSVLNNFVFNSKTLSINLVNLVPGASYSVQLFSVDDRTNTATNVVNFQSPTNAANISGTFASSSNVYVVGTFNVPTNSTGVLTNMVLQQNLSSTNGVINALVLRAVSFTPAINFTLLPINNNLDVGDTATFSSMATGPAPLAPQWQYGPAGGPYTNLTNGSHYSGVNTFTLSISNVVPADANNVYLLKLTSGTNNALSKSASLSVFGNAGVTKTVSNGGDINAAIEAVNLAGGGTVILAPGSYNGSVLMYPNVTLKGSGSNTVLVGGTLTQAYSGASYWSVEDLVIDGQVPSTYLWQGGADNAGINAGDESPGYDTYDLSFKNVEIKNTAIALRLVTVNGCYLTGCNFHDSGLGFSHNIYFVGCLNVAMSNCISSWSQANLSRSGDGVHLDFIGSTANYTLKQCEFSGNEGYGILCQDYNGNDPNLYMSGCRLQYNGLANQTNDGMWIIANGSITTTRSEYNGGYGLDTIYGPAISVDDFITGSNQSGGVYSTANVSNWLDGLTPNVYLAQQAEGVTGPGNTADWTTVNGGNGAGAVDFNANHSVNGGIVWPNVSAPAAGSYPLILSYANGSSNTLAMPVSVNGAYVGTAVFPPSGSWSTYGSATITANLSASNNTVGVDVLSPGLGNPELSKLTVLASVPAPPSGLTGLTVLANTNAPRTDMTTWMNLSWNPSPGATYYNIERNGFLIATGVTNTSFIDKHILGNDTTCSYLVAPVNAAGWGMGASVSAISIVAFPTSLTATGGPNSVILSCAAVPKARYYAVFRSMVSGGPYKKIATTTAAGYTDLNVSDGTSYYYVMTAIDGASQSLNSPEASATPYKAYLGAPILIDVDFGAAATQSGGAVLGTNGDTWNAASGTTTSIFNSSGAILSGVGLTLSGSGVYTDLGGTAMDNATAALMEDYAFGYTSATAKVSVSLTGLTNYRGAKFTLIVYAAGDNGGQGASLTLGGVTGGNSGSTLSTSALSRKISAGNGTAYQTFTGTIIDGTLSIAASELSGQSFTVINGFQIYLTHP